MGPAAGLPDGRRQLRRPALRARQEHRPRPEAGGPPPALEPGRLRGDSEVRSEDHPKDRPGASRRLRLPPRRHPY
nr:hypothetical protein [Methylobacterium frigidaeris]